ncbi:MAG: hypothetical protein KF819_19750 [Labilithrix sp.]|nr:hypothetical protein [Labilithrix sp.]
MPLRQAASRVRSPLVAVVGTIAFGTLAAIACTTDYQLGKEDVAYGGPNALAGKRPPAGTLDSLQDGGAGGSSGSNNTPKCVAAGGTLAGDGGACSVSFANDVLGAFGNAGCAAAGCHGGVTPQNEPRIEPSDGPGMWAEFQAFTISTGQAYINPCSTDDKESAMGCNLYPAGQVGACGVHMPTTGNVPATVIQTIETWLKCGSPNN